MTALRTLTSLRHSPARDERRGMIGMKGMTGCPHRKPYTGRQACDDKKGAARMLRHIRAAVTTLCATVVTRQAAKKSLVDGASRVERRFKRPIRTRHRHRLIAIDAATIAVPIGHGQWLREGSVKYSQT
jgi:hypothetical protein